MRTLERIREFQQEAAGAVFTKQQAVSVTLQLLQKEAADPANSPEERAVFVRAQERAEFRYIDATKTETDRMLDAIGVARFTVQDIVDGLEALLLDVQ